MKKRAITLCISLLVIGIAVAILLFPLTPITMWSQNAGAREQQRVIEIEIDPNVAKAAIEAANRFTGLNELQNVRITAEKVMIKEDEDDSPIAAIHSRIVGRPLIRVTYTASLPEWHGKRNPHIQAFNVLLDAKDLSLLKIASRWADNIDIKYKEGIKILRKEQVSFHAHDFQLMVSDALPNEPPKHRFIDILIRKHVSLPDIRDHNVKHIECYYVTKGKENRPVWYFVTYGGTPLPYFGGIPKPGTYPPLYISKYWLIDAITGDLQHMGGGDMN